MAPIFNFTENYDDGTTLTEAQLTALVDSIETALNTTGLDSTNIQTGGVAEINLASGSVTATKLGANSVTSVKLMSDSSVDANRAVTTDHIKNNAVTGAKLSPAAPASTLPLLCTSGSVLSYAAIDTDQLAAEAVTTAKIEDLAVTGAKIANTTITAGKLATFNYQFSNAVSQTISGSGYTTVTNLTVTIVDVARPVQITLDAEFLATSHIFRAASAQMAMIKILKDGSTLCIIPFGGSAGAWHPPRQFGIFDVPGAGSHTYTVEANANSGSDVVFTDVRMVAYERH